MTLDPTAEIKRIRHQLGADMDFDVHRIFLHLKQCQESSGRNYVRRPARQAMANHAIPVSSVGDASEDGKSNPAAR